MSEPEYEVVEVTPSDFDTPISKEAQVAAKWWADKLRTGFVPDNGSAEEEGTVANLKETNPLASSIFSLAREADEAQLTPEKIDAFEEALAEGIEDLIGKAYGDYGSTFGVDYHPDRILSDALAEAEIHESMTTLPWKTTMRVLPGSVKVGDGYGAAFQEIFS